ncbi:DUF938 domain-containing protein [Ruegeria sp. HKCCD7255]|uniref:DUF938 domain-containing protein n=1 Tax=Ruegeria sp. HKCCD7255 TaxID=2683004 RepID=UPI001488B391|nr:DUF938 domain-containing protein [Ruegeria sp. HKCCD7255]
MTERATPPSTPMSGQRTNNRLVAPAAARNADALCNVLKRLAPQSGKALELASGTGQHVAAFAQHLPGLNWQPTEIDPNRRASIDAYSHGLSNVATARHLDATVSGWAFDFGEKDLIVLINLLHLISWSKTEILIAETAAALAPGGQFVLYGPFMRNGQLTSAGDQRFHTALIQQDPKIGYKNDADILGLLKESGLNLSEIVDMPANNPAFVTQKPSGEPRP